MEKAENLVTENIEMEEKIEKKEYNHKKCLKEENYKYWRQVQREQLGISANLYFIFGSAILGFSLNFLINKKDALICESKILLIISIFFLIFSLFSYALFTNNRLNDFRDTAGYFNKDKRQKEVSKLTKEIGKRTWLYYDAQRFILFIGFIFALIGIGIYILN